MKTEKKTSEEGPKRNLKAKPALETNHKPSRDCLTKQDNHEKFIGSRALAGNHMKQSMRGPSAFYRSFEDSSGAAIPSGV